MGGVEKDGVDRRTVLKTLGGMMAAMGFGGFTKIARPAASASVAPVPAVRCVAVEYCGGLEYLELNPLFEELLRPSARAIHQAVPTVQVSMTRAEEAVMKEFLKTIKYGEEHPTKPYRYGSKPTKVT